MAMKGGKGTHLVGLVGAGRVAVGDVRVHEGKGDVAADCEKISTVPLHYSMLDVQHSWPH